VIPLAKLASDAGERNTFICSMITDIKFRNGPENSGLAGMNFIGQVLHMAMIAGLNRLIVDIHVERVKKQLEEIRR
jgi:hypothetical protein